jgi:hypothetical protein
VTIVQRPGAYPIVGERQWFPQAVRRGCMYLLRHSLRGTTYFVGSNRLKPGLSYKYHRTSENSVEPPIGNPTHFLIMLP